MKTPRSITLPFFCCRCFYERPDPSIERCPECGGGAFCPPRDLPWYRPMAFGPLLMFLAGAILIAACIHGLVVLHEILTLAPVSFVTRGAQINGRVTLHSRALLVAVLPCVLFTLFACRRPARMVQYALAGWVASALVIAPLHHPFFKGNLLIVILSTLLTLVGPVVAWWGGVVLSCVRRPRSRDSAIDSRQSPVGN